MAPTSKPRVGCAAINKSGLRSTSRAIIAFCWFPPDRARANVCSLGVRTSNCSISAFAFCVILLKFKIPFFENGFL